MSLHLIINITCDWLILSDILSQWIGLLGWDITHLHLELV